MRYTLYAEEKTNLPAQVVKLSIIANVFTAVVQQKSIYTNNI